MTVDRGELLGDGPADVGREHGDESIHHLAAIRGGERLRPPDRLDVVGEEGEPSVSHARFRSGSATRSGSRCQASLARSMK